MHCSHHSHLHSTVEWCRNDTLAEYFWLRLLHWTRQPCSRTQTWKRCWAGKSRSGTRLATTPRRRRRGTRCSGRRTNSPNKTAKTRRRSARRKVNAKDKTQGKGHFALGEVLLLAKMKLPLFSETSLAHLVREHVLITPAMLLPLSIRVKNNVMGCMLRMSNICVFWGCRYVEQRKCCPGIKLPVF